MYLRALRLRGFKSFPTRTELLFEPGVAVIIGPNGSGKSNVADAVQWALGEQSPTEVRGSSMQDVIFAGSDGRRASAAAEVELVFDNADGSLPLPTPEVSILRRVGRDGGSQYLINQSPCRLTDVVELMAGVGLGKELHSIIGQGKVETFLAGKPEDRRDQIEEAAGLGVYKRRRERAELKLREVRRNLERAETVEREVGGQLAPLRRQASAAEQRRAVETDIAGVRGRLLSGELATADEALARWRAEEAGLDAGRAEAERRLEALAAERAGEEEAFAKRLAERERRTRRLLRVRALDGRLEAAARLAAQRVRLLDEVERAGRAERERLLAELAVSGEDPDPEVRRREDEALEETAAEAARLQSGAEAALADAQAEAARVRAEAGAAQRERDHALADATRLERRAEAVGAERTRLERQAEHLAAELEGRREGLGAAQESERGARAEAAAAATAAEAAGAAAAEAHRELEEAETRHGQTARERAAVEREIEDLRAALSDVHDVDAEVLTLAGEYPGTAEIAGLVGCEPGYERALGAALAQLSGALAVPERVDAWALFGALRRAGVGLVRLVLSGRGRRAATTFPGAAPLLDKVTFEGGEDMPSVLADVVIVDDLRAVPASFPGLAVTRNGEYYRPSSGQLGIAGGVPAALVLERRATLETLRGRLDAVRAREVRETAALERARARAADRRAAAGEAAKDERQARIAAESAERELATLRSRVADLEDGAARARRGAEALAAEIAEAQGEAERLQTVAATSLTRAQQLAPELAAAEDAAATAAATHERALAATLRARVELDERRRARARAEEERRRAQERAEEGRRRLAALEKRLDLAPGVRSACEELGTRLRSVREHTQALGDRLEEHGPAEEGLDRDGLRRLAEREAEERRRLQDAAARRTEVEVALARLDDRRREVAVELEEVSAALEQAKFAPPVDDDEAAALRDELARLERRRERIGPVNPLAEAECAELGERAAFLREQRRDLERSLEELRGLIRELTERIDLEFNETFAAVERQFSHMVGVLFPGGRGRLVLVAGDEEGAGPGVAVEVKPAKKLGKKLQLLSGGERALVAIAFLMALVLARPCPFYILDEIEAALDDVNISRFVSLLREYRDRTQFVLITHQKRTMEAADVLYGVTMGPDGASQVVSARMAEAEIDREAQAAGGRGQAGSGSGVGGRDDSRSPGADAAAAEAAGATGDGPGADGPPEDTTDDGAR